MRRTYHLRCALLLSISLYPLCAPAQTAAPDLAEASLPKRCKAPSGLPADGSTNKKPAPRIIIDSVDFDDSSDLPPAEREGLVDQIKEQDLTDHPSWTDELTEVTVRGFLQDRGYFKVVTEATPQLLFTDSEGEHFAVHLHVESGIQYRLREIQFRLHDCFYPTSPTGPEPEGDRPTLRRRTATEESWPPEPCALQSAFPESELRSLVPLNDGDVFVADAIRKSLQTLHDLYAAHGFVDFVAEPIFDLDDSKEEINLLIDLDEQKRFTYRSVQIFGLDPSTESSLRAKLVPGDTVNLEVLDDFFKENAANLPPGTSRRKNVTESRDIKTGTEDITVDLRPCP